jgi:preprotein translocase subunit SecF
MWIIKNRKIFYSISALLIGFSIFAIAFWGIKFGIDFTGGSILEFEFTEVRPEKQLVTDNVSSLENENSLELGDFSLRETGDKGYILRTQTIDDSTKTQIIDSIKTLNESGEVLEIRFNTIGPTLGDELQGKALFAVFLVVLFIILFIAYAFRHVSKPVSSWKYGFVAIIAFFHDVLIPVGLFSILGQFYGIEVDTLFVVAILVVLGYSINDTIVVFDRIRENLREYPEKSRQSQFEKIVGKSLKQTIARSINTSITTAIALLAIFFLGGESTKYFSLALLAGVISGTYSSIFFASPMLVTMQKFQNKRVPKKVAVK